MLLLLPTSFALASNSNIEASTNCYSKVMETIKLVDAMNKTHFFAKDIKTEVSSRINEANVPATKETIINYSIDIGIPYLEIIMLYDKKTNSCTYLSSTVTAQE